MSYLVGGLELEHVLFLHILRRLIPTDDVIFFTGLWLNHQPDMISIIFQSVFWHLIWKMDSQATKYAERGIDFDQIFAAQLA